jgi:hypothetical protein
MEKSEWPVNKNRHWVISQLVAYPAFHDTQCSLQILSGLMGRRVDKSAAAYWHLSYQAYQESR